MRACPRCRAVYASDLELCALDGDRLVLVDSDPLVGRTLAKYRLDESLGATVRGREYRAKDFENDRDVLIEILFGELAADSDEVDRFQRASAAAAGVES